MKIFRKIISVFLVLTLFLASYLPLFGPVQPLIKLAEAETCSDAGGNLGQNLGARVGGVALDQAATFLAQMDDITGAYYDATLDRIVFVGKKNTTLPEFDKDDLAVAIRALVFNRVIPAVSIEPPLSDDPTMMRVMFYGGIENTKFGKVLFDSDFALKHYLGGYDKNGNRITTSVPGYKNMTERFIDKNPTPGPIANQTRWWIVPKLMSLKRDDVADAFVFDQAIMEVKTEQMSANNDPKWNEAAEEFSTHHTQYFDQFAQETLVYSEAKQLGKIVSVVKWLVDRNISTDFNWARDNAPKIVSTPNKIPIESFSGTYNGWSYTFYGGVGYMTPNSYSTDTTQASNLKNASQAIPTTKEDIHWTFSKDGQQYESVAVAADAFRTLGSYNISEADMSFPTAGDMTLAFQRSYSSYSSAQYGAGRGWNIFPAELYDNKAGWTVGCSGQSHPWKLGINTPSGLHETFTYYNCTVGYVADDPSYHSKITQDTNGVFTITLKDQRQLFFLPNFKLGVILDKNGNSISYGYNSNWTLKAIKDNKNHQINLNYNTINGQSLIATVQDWSGRIVNYTYDDQGNLLTVKDLRGNATTYAYDSNFKLTSITNREGKKVVENTFTPEAKLATQKDASDMITSYNHDDTTKTITISDSLGRNQKTKYDDKARVIEEVDPLLKSVTYTYGSELLPLTITDKNNNTVTYVYDANGNNTSVTFPDTKKITYEYDTKNRVTRILDYRYGTTPKETKLVYDSNNNLTQSNEAGVIQNYTYDTSGEMLTKIDSLSHQTTWTRDDFGNKLTETNATNKTTTYEYDVLARLKKVIDANARTSSFTYDNNGNLLTITNALGVTTNEYDKENQLLKITKPNNASTEFSYNSFGLLSSIKDPLANLTYYDYDSYQNLTSSQDALNHTTLYLYDQLNRQTQSTTPLGKVAKWEYDSNGNITKRIDANNKTTVYTYDVFNRLTKITYPDAKTVNYTYDDRGNVTKIVDPIGTTTYTYDVLDRLVNAVNPYSRQIIYAYDSSNNLTKITYPDARAVNYLYDANNRLISAVDWNNKVTSYTYHNNGLLATRVMPNGVTSNYSYDEANKLSNLEHVKAGTILAKFAYVRDSLGNITKVTEEGSFFPGAPSITPTPTQTPAPTSTPAVPTTTPTPTSTVPINTPTPTPVGSTPTPTPTPTSGGPAPDLVVTSITTTPANPGVNTLFTTSVTIKNQGTVAVPTTGFRLAFYYDLAQAPTATTAYTSSTIVLTNALGPGQSKVYSKTNSKFTTTGQHTIYAYVDQENTISESNEANNIGGPQIVTIASSGVFKSLFAGWMTSITGIINPRAAFAQQQFPQYVTNFGYDALARLASAQYPSVTFGYTYDKVDNRLSMQVTAATQSATINYIYNNDNQFTTTGGMSSTYDNNGNQITRSSSQGTTGFIYNFEDRLTKYTPPTGSATTYVYDGNNNRLNKVVGSSTTRFVTDVSQSLPRTIAETNSANTITKSYVYGLGLISQGTATVASRDYYLEDGQGNIRFVTDENGIKVRSSDFDPFGNWLSAHGQANIHMLYQGQQQDPESSLYYLRARYYDSALGRFISKDPVKGYLEIPQTQNSYAYSINNPINLSDPSGEDILQNQMQGASFEKACLDTYNAVKNTLPLTNYGNKIPDILTESNIGEIKSGSYTSLTNQMRSFVQYSADSGKQFTLYIKEGAKVSGPLVAAIQGVGGAIVTAGAVGVTTIIDAPLILVNPNLISPDYSNAPTTPL